MELDVFSAWSSCGACGAIFLAPAATSAPPILRAELKVALPAPEFSFSGKKDHYWLKAGGLPDIEVLRIAFGTLHSRIVRSVGNICLSVTG
jgi:hypothetical protein